MFQLADVYLAGEVIALLVVQEDWVSDTCDVTMLLF